MMRSYQQRLAMKQDVMRRKLIDNIIEHTGDATDCIRIHLTKTDEGDIITRQIESADIVSVVFPPMKDIPYRRLSKTNNEYQITSLVSAGMEDFNTNYIVQVPHYEMVTTDDLIIRVLQDPEVKIPFVFALQVIESLGTFGGQMLIYQKFNTCLYNETLNPETLQIIGQMAERRLNIGF